MRSVKKIKPGPAPVKRPSNPPEIVSYCQHDTNGQIRRPQLVARAEATHPAQPGRTITVEVGKQKGCGFIVYGEGKAIDGFYASEQEARRWVPEFAQALLVTSALWLLMFAALALVFPGGAA